MTEIIDTNNIINKINTEITEALKNASRYPKAVFIQIGNNQSSEKYIKMKQRACEKVNIKSEHIKLPNSITHNQLIDIIRKLNKDSDIDGILIQLPLPEQINCYEIINSISSNKDVDGLTSENILNFESDQHHLISCIPAIIINILKEKDINLNNSNVLICGKNNVAFYPMLNIFAKFSHSITICDETYKKLPELVANNDIVISCENRPNIIKSIWLKENAIAFDIGNSYIDDFSSPKGYRIVGDIEFNPSVCKASYITPVPGGMGQLGIAQLVYNIFKAYQNNRGK